MDELRTLITPRTKLISVTYVSNVLGVINPVREIIEIGHSKSIPVLIDGAQAVQHMPIDVQSLDCDFFVFSGHKMYAETGIGVLYGKEQWLAEMPPYQAGGGMVASVDMDGTTYADVPFKFEAGTANIAAAISMKEAIDYVDGLGMDAIASHEKDLMDYAVERLGGIKGLTLYAGEAKRCGAISFNLEGVSSYDAGMILDKLGVAVRTGNHCAEPVMKRYGVNGMIRASFAVYNTRQEVERLVEGLQRVRQITT
jgi:cysteine desulfurase/selenocysteine lyase